MKISFEDLGIADESSQQDSDVPAGNALAVDFLSAEPVFFERMNKILRKKFVRIDFFFALVWFGDRLLDCGDADCEIINSIHLPVTHFADVEGIALIELYLFAVGSGTTPRPSKQKFFLNVPDRPPLLKPDVSERFNSSERLLRRTCIKLQKGFLLLPRTVRGRLTISCIPRLDIVVISLSCE